MVRPLIRLDLGNVSLALMAGATLSLGFIQLLAGPLESVANLSVQVLAMNTTVLVAPLVIILLVLLRHGPMLIRRGGLLAPRQGPWLQHLWFQQLVSFVTCTVGLLPYVLAAALVASMTTRPEIDSLNELRFLLGNLNPLMLAFSLLKTALFAAITLGISLQQGARARRRGLTSSAGFSRAITITMAVILALDLVWALVFTPLTNGSAL